jgi:hypothetical protein
LRLLPRFSIVWVVSLTGWVLLAVTLWQRRRNPEGQGTSTSIAWPYLALVALALAAHIGAQSFVTPVGRYRLALVPYLILPAAWFAVHLWHRFIANDGRALGRAVGCLAGIWLAWWIWPAHPALALAARRPADYKVGAEILAKRGDAAGARRELDQLLPVLRDLLPPEQRGLAELKVRYIRLGLFARLNRLGEVGDDWRMVSQFAPNDPLVRALRPRFEPGAPLQSKAP